LKRSDPQQHTVEVQPPPASTAITTVDELSPEAFLALHGVPVPRRVKSYASFDAAVRGVIADVSKG
jgi:hypothetical protein